MQPFTPAYGTNQVVTPGAVSAQVAIGKSDLSVRLVNTGANVCYVKIGTGTLTASTADLPVRSASEVIVRKADGHDALAYISAAGATLNIQTGCGGV